MLPLLGSSMFVVALPVRPPVRISRCEISHSTQELNVAADIGVTTVSVNELRVRFTDVSDQPVTRIVFALDDGETILDVGTFAPATSVDHTFALDPNGAESCNVESVTFRDGTQWSASRDTTALR
jgi:hypothetical protein